MHLAEYTTLLLVCVQNMFYCVTELRVCRLMADLLKDLKLLATFVVRDFCG